MGDDVSKDYWSGGTWVYQGTIDNGAGGGGDVTWSVIPGVGNEMEIIFGTIANTDSAARITAARFRDAGGNSLASLTDITSTAAGATRSFPVASEGADDEAVSAGGRYILSGTAELLGEVRSAAASQGGFFGILARIRGGVPTVTEAGNSTPTITINTERTF